MQELEIRDLNQEINPEFAFKVVILGDSGVGKTSLVKYEIQNSFINNNNDSTIIFEHSFKNYSIMGKNVRLQIWDTCGKKCTVLQSKIFIALLYAYLLFFL